MLHDISHRVSCFCFVNLQIPASAASNGESGQEMGSFCAYKLGGIHFVIVKKTYIPQNKTEKNRCMPKLDIIL